MKRMIVAGLVLSAALAFVAGPRVQAAQKAQKAEKAQTDDALQPSIYLPQIHYNMGKVFEQAKYEHEFIVQNRGKADLIIEQVKPG